MRAVADDVSLQILEWSKDQEILRRQIEAVLGKRSSPKLAKKKKPTKHNAKPRREPKQIQRFWENEPWQENFISTLPPYIQCAGEDFAKGTFKRSRDLALNYPHIQVNSPCRKVWLPFDLDSSDAVRAHEAADLPAPNIVVENMANGHAHALYQLSVPVTFYARSRQSSIHFLADIQRGMTRRLGADRGYSGHLAKNPISDAWRVHHLRDGAYSLTELAHPLRRKVMRRWEADERESGLGRNVALFDALRKDFAYRDVRRFKAEGRSQAEFRARLQSIADGLNATMDFHAPLPASEVRGIVKSVANWTWKNFSVEGFRRHQRRASAKANAKRWKDHTPLSVSRPWEAEGISRRTWFRRQKVQNGANGQA